MEVPFGVVRFAIEEENEYLKKLMQYTQMPDNNPTMQIKMTQSAMFCTSMKVIEFSKIDHKQFDFWYLLICVYYLF